MIRYFTTILLAVFLIVTFTLGVGAALALLFFITAFAYSVEILIDFIIGDE